MTLISFAQNGEDVVLWRALGHVENGFYIDIGACDPTELSVTRLFYDHGWSGINVEPAREYYERCVAERPRDLNLNAAVTARAGEVRFLNVPGTGLSTTLDDIATKAASHGFTVEARDVPALSLADVCAKAQRDTIHFLKIDVEGGEQAVLEGADFQRFRPWVVLVEATVPLSTERNDAQWRHLLLDAGYEQAYFDGVNLYFVAREHRELAEKLAIPPNALDDYKPVALHEAEQRVAALSTSLASAEARLQDATQAAARELATTREALEQERGAVEREQRRRSHLQSQLEELQKQSARSDAQLASLDQLLARMAGPARHSGETLLERLEAHLQHGADEAAMLRQSLDEAARLQQSMLASTSWRITAPLRQTRRMIQPRPKLPEPAAATPAPSPAPAPAPSPHSLPGEPRGKNLARRIFHRGMQTLLQVPGAREGVRLVHGMAPAPVEWLALRYRAYDRRAGEVQITRPVEIKELQSALAPEAVASLDMSDEEARLYRQFVTGSLSLSAAR